MKINLFAIFTVTMIFSCMQAQATTTDASPCLDAKFSDTPVLTMRKLPPKMVEKMIFVNDRGSELGSGDVGLGIYRRFVLALVSTDCILVEAEHNSGPSNTVTWAFLRKGSEWESGPGGNIDGVTQSASEFLTWSQTALGSEYEIGIDVPKNYEEAIKWYQRAADKGHYKAQWALGEMYGEGKGVPKDKIIAAYWYELSAPKHIPANQSLLGGKYIAGIEVVQDYDKAIKWLRLATDRGDSYAPILLGELYSEENSVIRNDIEAVKFYRLSLNHEDGMKAAYKLSKMYALGKGVAQNSVIAAALLHFSNKNLDPKETEQDFVKIIKNMSIMEIKDANNLYEDMMIEYKKGMAQYGRNSFDQKNRKNIGPTAALDRYLAHPTIQETAF